MSSACKVCQADNMEEQERLGLMALQGHIPWAEAQRQLGLPNFKGLQNHMRRHVQQPPSPEERLADELSPLIQQAVDELTEQMQLVPAEVKPFYLTAIVNLRKLHETKPSQQHLLAALKGIHEVTGMRMEQRLMLEFAKHHFGIGAGDAQAALEKHADVMDVEPVEDE